MIKSIITNKYEVELESSKTIDTHKDVSTYLYWERGEKKVE